MGILSVCLSWAAGTGGGRAAAWSLGLPLSRIQSLELLGTAWVSPRAPGSLLGAASALLPQSFHCSWCLPLKIDFGKASLLWGAKG